MTYGPAPRSRTPHPAHWPIAAALGCLLLHAAWPAPAADRASTRPSRHGKAHAALQRAVVAALPVPPGAVRRDPGSGLWLSTALSVTPIERPTLAPAQTPIASLPTGLGLLDARGRLAPLIGPMTTAPAPAERTALVAPVVPPSMPEATAQPEAIARRSDAGEDDADGGRRAEETSAVSGSRTEGDVSAGTQGRAGQDLIGREDAPQIPTPQDTPAEAAAPGVTAGLAARRAGALVALVSPPRPAAQPALPANDATPSNTNIHSAAPGALPDHCGSLQRAWLAACARLSDAGRGDDAAACTARASQRASQCLSAPAPARYGERSAAAATTVRRASSPEGTAPPVAQDRKAARIVRHGDGATLEWYGAIDGGHGRDGAIEQPVEAADAASVAAMEPPSEPDHAGSPPPQDVVTTRRRGKSPAGAASPVSAARPEAAVDRGEATLRAAPTDFCAQALTEATKRCSMLDSMAPGSLQACLDVASGRNADCLRLQRQETSAPAAGR